MQIKVAAIYGPTASGKTRLAAELARRHGGEVVSADSMQVYKGMQIGTAKPTEAEMLGVRHHLIGFLEPTQSFSVAEYVPLARACVEDISARGRLPVLAGGTGLYLRAALQNLSFCGTEPDEALRASLCARAQEKGSRALYEELREIDPAHAERLHPNDTKRIVRALELYRTAGRTMSEQLARSGERPNGWKICKLALCFEDRKALYKRIDQRVDRMLEEGLLEEAKAFLEADCGKTAVQAIGYKELARYFSGEAPLSEAVETIKRETRRYAKRQMTWLRREEGLNWIAVDACGDWETVLARAETILRESAIIS